MEAPTRTILVTGSHRSGTTWVGKVLATAPRTAYIHEPFNVDRPSDFTTLRMTHWYQRLNASPDGHEGQALEDLVSRRWRSPALRWSDWRNPRALYRTARTSLRRQYAARIARHIVLKDPLALLSADWLATHFAVMPVVMVRHPAAFVASVLLKGWSFDFQNFLRQPAVIDEFFPEDRSAIVAQTVRGEHDLLGGAALLWRLLHKVIQRYQEQHPAWIYLRHEDVSADPAVQFCQLFERLNLPFTARTAGYLRNTSETADRRYVLKSTSIHNVVRDSRQNIHVWQQRLQPAEITRIRTLVGETAEVFYCAGDWNDAPHSAAA